MCGPSCRHPFNLVHALRRMRAATRWSRVRAVTRPDTPVTQNPAKGGRISLGIHTRVLPRCYQFTSHQHAEGELRLTPDHQSYVVLDRPASAQIGPERNS